MNRPDKEHEYKPDWMGVECSGFIVGYGLDYNQRAVTTPAYSKDKNNDGYKQFDILIIDMNSECFSLIEILKEEVRC